MANLVRRKLKNVVPGTAVRFCGGFEWYTNTGDSFGSDIVLKGLTVNFVLYESPNEFVYVDLHDLTGEFFKN